MGPEELAWAAGLFEGRGRISVHRIRHHPKRKAPWEGRYALAELKGGDQELVLRFVHTVGLGVVAGPFQSASAPFWRWRAHGSDALAVIELLRPWLGQEVLAQAAEVQEVVGASGAGSP